MKFAGHRQAIKGDRVPIVPQRSRADTRLVECGAERMRPTIEIRSGGSDHDTVVIMTRL